MLGPLALLKKFSIVIATCLEEFNFLAPISQRVYSMDKSQLSGEYYYRLYWAHALISYYLTTGRKYVLIEKYGIAGNFGEH